MLQKFLLLVLVTAAEQSLGQDFVYAEPGNPACPVVSPPASAVPKKVEAGVAIPGSIRVSCGFGNGSYTVTLSSTDPAAAFSPRSFLVNFGSLSGPGTFTVTFGTAGTHKIGATITANMGSPGVSGSFNGSLANDFAVVSP